MVTQVQIDQLKTLVNALIPAPPPPPPPPTPPPDTEFIWINDALPTGAVEVINPIESWNWINDNPTPYLGLLAHQSINYVGIHQHAFQNATQTMQVNAGDTLFTWVYLNVFDPPIEIMLQWRVGSDWAHRAYWGANKINWGINGTISRQFVNVLPDTGQWVKLEVPAAQVGLEGKVVNGMTFTLLNGRATWDYIGKHI